MKRRDQLAAIFRDNPNLPLQVKQLAAMLNIQPGTLATHISRMRARGMFVPKFQHGPRAIGGKKN